MSISATWRQNRCPSPKWIWPKAFNMRNRRHRAWEWSDHTPADRPGWERLLAYVRPGDTVIVTELSRMTRSLVHLLEVMAVFEHRTIALISLREHIDTATATGRCFLAMMGAMAQMERELKAERTAAGRAAAKARGRTGGRPRTDPDKLEQARILYRNSDQTATEVCGA